MSWKRDYSYAENITEILHFYHAELLWNRVELLLFISETIDI